MPRLVSDELWEAAQLTMAEKPRQHAYLLAGKLFDAETGTPYRGTGGTSCTGRTYLYYSVPTGDGHERRFPRADVERAVLRALAAAFADREFSESVARAAVLAMESDADSPEVRSARARLEEVGRREANILRAVEMGVVPPGTDGRLSELSEERSRLEARLSAAAEAVPTVDEMAEWVRTRLAKRPADTLLRNAVSRCTLDAEGNMTVEIPWRSSSNSLSNGLVGAQKNGERPASGQFAEFRFGSPYQIRTGDLRLERVIPHQRLRTTDIHERASEQVFCSNGQQLTEPDENGVPVAIVSRLCPAHSQLDAMVRSKETTMNHSAADIEAMCELEDYSHFRAELVEISPQSFTLEELKEILGDMIRSKVALEDSMREHFATLGEIEQTQLLDMLGASDCKDRDWWHRMLMDGPVHREFQTI